MPGRDRVASSTAHVALGRTVKGKFGSTAVRLFELGEEGFFLASAAPLSVGRQDRLSFTWRRTSFKLVCEVMGCHPASVEEALTHFPGEEMPFRADLRLVEASRKRQKLSELIAGHRHEIELAQEANALGLRHANVIDGDMTLTAISAGSRRRGLGFLSFHFESPGWRKTVSLLNEQPEDGFTVAAGEDPEQIAQLCTAYEMGTSEERNLIREMASMSIRDQGK